MQRRRATASGGGRDHRTLKVQRDEAFNLAHVAGTQGDVHTEFEQMVRGGWPHREPLPQVSSGAWYLNERGDDVEPVVERRRNSLAAQKIKERSPELACLVRDGLEHAIAHVKNLTERVRQAAVGFDLSGYSERARDLVQGLRIEDRADYSRKPNSCARSRSSRSISGWFMIMG